jgi:hypothetical protein
MADRSHAARCPAPGRERLPVLEEQLAAKYPEQFGWFLTSEKLRAELLNHPSVVLSTDPAFRDWRSIMTIVETVEHNDRPPGRCSQDGR